MRVKQAISKKEKQALRKFLLLQLIVVLCVALIINFLWSRPAGMSALFGGLLVWVPSILLAIIIFACNTYRDPKKIVNTFYIGEMLKIVLTAVLLIFILRGFAVMLAPLLIGMIAAYMIYLFYL